MGRTPFESAVDKRGHDPFSPRPNSAWAGDILPDHAAHFHSCSAQRSLRPLRTPGSGSEAGVPRRSGRHPARARSAALARRPLGRLHADACGLAGQPCGRPTSGGRRWRRPPVQLTNRRTAAPRARAGRRTAAQSRSSRAAATAPRVFVLPADGGAARAAHTPRHGVSQPRGRPTARRSISSPPTSEARKARARTPARRCVCVRGELQAAASVEGAGEAGGGAARTPRADRAATSRCCRIGCRAMAARSCTHRAPTPLAGDAAAERSLGDGRRRRPRGRSPTTASRRPTASCRRTTRSVLFIAEASDALEPYHSARCSSRPRPAARRGLLRAIFLRDRARGLVAGRPEHSRRREHGRAQRDLCGSTSASGETGRSPTGGTRSSSGA